VKTLGSLGVRLKPGLGELSELVWLRLKNPLSEMNLLVVPKTCRVPKQGQLERNRPYPLLVWSLLEGIRELEMTAANLTVILHLFPSAAPVRSLVLSHALPRIYSLMTIC